MYLVKMDGKSKWWLGPPYLARAASNIAGKQRSQKE